MRAAGQEPDDWQAEYLRRPFIPNDRELLLCCRGAGKTRATAARSLWRMLTRPGHRTLFFAPTQRQTDEMMAYLYDFWHALGRPLAGRKRAPTEAARSLKLVNGSRALALTDNQKGVRGFHVQEIVLDEAAQISDTLFYSVRAMVLRSRGGLVVPSTPYGKRGWFFEEWADEERRWQRMSINAGQCGRYSDEQLAEERKSMGERWFKQEFECSFEDTVNAVFSSEDIMAALASDVTPMSLE